VIPTSTYIATSRRRGFRQFARLLASSRVFARLRASSRVFSRALARRPLRGGDRNHRSTIIIARRRVASRRRVARTGSDCALSHASKRSFFAASVAPRSLIARASVRRSSRRRRPEGAGRDASTSLDG